VKDLYKNLSEILKGRDHSEDLGIDGTGFFWLRIRKMAESCEHGNEPSGSIKCDEFLD
jgi:hypothetical protein